MKIILWSFICLCSSVMLFGQVNNKPVTWELKATQVEGSQFVIEFIPSIKDGWYVYSQFIDEGGPIPTSFEFDEDESFELNGEVLEEGDAIRTYDELFEMDMVFYKKEVAFSQILTVLSDQAVVEGFFTFMTCNGTSCLPPEDVDFSFSLEP